MSAELNCNAVSQDNSLTDLHIDVSSVCLCVFVCVTVETLQALVNGSLGGAMASIQEGGGAGPVCLPRRAETFGGFDSHQMHSSKSKSAAACSFFMERFCRLAKWSATEPRPAAALNCTDSMTELQMCGESPGLKSKTFHFSP